MQFIPNGPDVPGPLLQAHEQGRVVFFTGAGISSPAKLPLFGPLVDSVYKRLSLTREGPEEQTWNAKQYDSTLSLLAERVGDQKVRREVASILTPSRFPTGATATQEALLTLSRDERGDTRLITTNFDRLFEKVIATKRLGVPTFRAPLLPVPKASRWNGLVYLHGLLPKDLDASERELESLVMTSGDFGLAYLTERWAARFASELFRNFVVCFVGYSIADPVLRYMMDALAADRSKGEGTPQAYAFGSFEGGARDKAETSWLAKGVIPILYEVPAGTTKHDALHNTLGVWAATYQSGVAGKEQLIVRYAVNPPGGSTKEDDFAGRILWAASHLSGLPAKLFAELDPVPPLEWLEVFESARFNHDDLPAFQVTPDAARDKKLQYSLMRRPTRYGLAEQMSLFRYEGWHDWDGVMEELARWLTRHMDDRDLILRVATSRAQLHPSWVRIIERHLATIDDLRAKGQSSELARLRVNAPRSIPRPFMRTLWRAAIAGRIRTQREHFDQVTWLRNAKEGLSATLRIQLREMLAPRLELSKPFEWGGNLLDGDEELSEADNNGVDWEVVLSLQHPWEPLIDHLQKQDPWRSHLPSLLADFVLLLREALDLMDELGGVVDQLDQGHIAQAAIGDHPQNRRNKDWTGLLELTRDAWLAMHATSPSVALSLATEWWRVPYATFKRLALFAATKTADDQLRASAVDWLLEDDARWLWEDDLRYEVIRVLVEVVPHVARQVSERLQTALLSGPPPGKWRTDIDPEDLRRYSDHDIWLRLRKMEATGQFLTPEAIEVLASMPGKYPDTRWAKSDRDEFSFWMGIGTFGDDDDDDFFVEKHEPLPADLAGVIQWLKANPASPRFARDEWRKACSDDFELTSNALRLLSEGEFWPLGRWHEALQAWSEPGRIVASWEKMSPIVLTANDARLKELSHPLSRWILEVARNPLGSHATFEALTNRLLDLVEAGDLAGSEAVGVALNHPIGQITDAYFRWWFSTDLRDDQGLRSPFKALFTRIAQTDVLKFRHGRVFLAKNAIALFRVDREWSQEHLLDLFDWANEAEALSAWKGFLWTPQLYSPFMTELKVPFLQTAERFALLGDHGRQYADLLTFAALDGSKFLAARELAVATKTMPPEGLAQAAHTLERALSAAGTKAASYWLEHVVPYLKQIWPQDRALRSQPISEAMARIAIAAESAFPQALGLVKDWLMPVESADYPVHLLATSGLAGMFPVEALDLLDRVVSVDALWAPAELRRCLDDIASAKASLKDAIEFRRLHDFCRKHNK